MQLTRPRRFPKLRTAPGASAHEPTHQPHNVAPHDTRARAPHVRSGATRAANRRVPLCSQPGYDHSHRRGAAPTTHLPDAVSRRPSFRRTVLPCCCVLSAAGAQGAVETQDPTAHSAAGHAAGRDKSWLDSDALCDGIFAVCCNTFFCFRFGSHFPTDSPPGSPEQLRSSVRDDGSHGLCDEVCEPSQPWPVVGVGAASGGAGGGGEAVRGAGCGGTGSVDAAPAHGRHAVDVASIA